MINRIKAKYHYTKHNIKIILEFRYWKISSWFHYQTNSLIRKQLKNPTSIPIIIISFNQLLYLKQLIEFLLKNNFSNIVIIDNYSTYQPLLSYFDTLSENKNITIHRLNENIGHLVFWKKKELFEKYSVGFYVVTDADIVPMEEVPSDFLTVFLKLLNHSKEITKVGFSLFLGDIPNSNPNKENIINWENQFWQEKMDNHYLSSIDTTFAIYRPNFKREEECTFLKGIRTGDPYIARHGGWYLDPKNLTDEQKFYIKTANYSSSWLADEDGKLKNDFFRTHYNKNEKE